MAGKTICEKVELSIKRALSSTSFQVQCEAENRQITLRGIVQSRNDRTLCAIIARIVPGVCRVNNLISVIERGPQLAPAPHSPDTKRSAD